MCKPGDVYTYELKNNIRGVVRACLRPFVITGITEDECVIAVPLTTNDNDFADDGRVYSSLVVRGITKKICFLSDVSVCIAKEKLIKKIAHVEGDILTEIQKRSRNNELFYDDVIERTPGEVEILDEDEIVKALESIEGLNDGSKNYPETDGSIIIDSNSILMAHADDTLYIPLAINDEKIGSISLKFASDDGERSIKIDNIDDGLSITCHNFNDSFGSFTVEPIEIGKVNDKSLSINIRSSLSGKAKNSRVVEYTVFWEK